MSEPTSLRFFKSESIALNQQIAKTIDKGAVEQVYNTLGQKVKNIFLRPKKGWSFETPHFQHEKPERIRKISTLQDGRNSLELKDAYFRVNTQKDDRKCSGSDGRENYTNLCHAHSVWHQPHGCSQYC